MSGHVPEIGDYEFAEQIDAPPKPIDFWEAARPTTPHDQHEATMKHQIATAAATAAAQISEMDVDAGSPAGAAASGAAASGAAASVGVLDDCPADCEGNCQLCREYTKWKNKKDGVDKKNSRRKKAAERAGRQEWVREPPVGIKMKPRWKETAAYRAYRRTNIKNVHTSRQNNPRPPMGAAFTDLSVG